MMIRQWTFSQMADPEYNQRTFANSKKRTIQECEMFFDIPDRYTPTLSTHSLSPKAIRQYNLPRSGRNSIEAPPASQAKKTQGFTLSIIDRAPTEWIEYWIKCCFLCILTLCIGTIIAKELS